MTDESCRDPSERIRDWSSAGTEVGGMLEIFVDFPESDSLIIQHPLRQIRPLYECSSTIP